MPRTTVVAAATLSLLLLVGSAPAQPQQESDERTPEPQRVAVLATDPGVIVTLCAGSGHVTVRGWERSEVRASAPNKADVAVRAAEQGGGAAPVRAEVLITQLAALGVPAKCKVFSNVKLDVPRRAVVWVQTGSGSITVEGVAQARLKTLSGTIDVRRVSERTEVDTISGDVFLLELAGVISAHSSSGNITASEAAGRAPSDTFKATSVSGNVALEQITYRQVAAETVSGQVGLRGALAPGGRYDLKSILGDVTLTLPCDASFQVNASVSPEGKIVDSFMSKGGAAQAPRGLHKLTGTYGSGDAILFLSSFSGTLRLRPQ